ncbi:MAG: hypothetical protein AB7N29_16270 [Vicinamibacterales bacterium]
MVWMLATVGLWKAADTKDTIVWFVLSGCAVALSGVQMHSRVPSVQQILKDQLGALIVIEYLIATFTFSFWVEFLLAPMIAFFALLNGVAQAKAEYASVRQVTGCLLAVVGFVVAGMALRATFMAIDQISLPSVAREIALPILLTVTMLPVAYAFFVISAYEQIFVRVDTGIKDPALRTYVRRRLFRSLRLNPRRIRDFIDSHRGRFITASSNEEVDQWIATLGVQGGEKKE